MIMKEEILRGQKKGDILYEQKEQKQDFYNDWY